MVKHLRLLLSALFLAVFSSSMFAADVTVTFTAGTDMGATTDQTADKVEKDGVSINANSAALGRTDNYRFYANSEFTVTAPGNITQIVFTASSADYASKLALSEGSTGTLTIDGVTATWTGDAASVVFKPSAQSRVTEVKITYTADADAVPAPTISPAAGTYYEAQTVTITGEEGATIQYAIGEGEWQTYAEPFTVSETSTVKAKQTVGEKESSVVSANIVIAAQITTLADLNAKAADKVAVRFTLPEAGLLVSYVNGKNIYLTDGSKAIMLYGKEVEGLKAGDKVNGTIDGTATLYNGLPELDVNNGAITLTTISEGNAVAPVKVDAAALAADFAAYANMLVTVKGATFAEAFSAEGEKNNHNFTVGESAFVLRNNFALTYSYEAGTYDITVLVGGIYREANQLYPIAADFAAEPWAPVVADGEYLIQNVEAGTFLGAGNSWGTQASLLKHGDIITLHADLNAEGYALEGRVNNGGEQYYLTSGGYMDGRKATAKLLPVEGTDYVAITFDGTNFFGSNGSSVVALNLTDATQAAAQWKFISVADAKADLTNATAEEPKDATFLIKDANFGRNNRDFDAWNKTNITKGGDNTNCNVESWQKTFSISQELTELPAGVYSLTAQALYRYEPGAEHNGENLPVIFANEATTQFAEIIGQENSMAQVSTSFSNGMYQLEPTYVVVGEDGKLTIGAKQEVRTDLWQIFDNFELTYYGNTTIEAVKNITYIKAYNAALAAATAAAAQEMAEADKAAVDAAITEATIADVETATAEELIVATEKLNAVIPVANKAAVKHANIKRAAEKIAARDYDFTEFIINPTFEVKGIEGWTSQDGGGVTSNGNFPLATDTETKDTNPFFVERWTWSGAGADMASLSNGKLSQEIEGLPAGHYTLTAAMQNLQQGDASVVTGGYFLQLGTARTEVSAANTYSVEFDYDGTNALEVAAVLEGCTGNWVCVDNFKLTINGLEKEFTVAHERYAGMGYGATEAEVDLTEALAFIGVEKYEDATLVGINVTDGSIVTDYAGFDGWRNAEGNFVAWGETSSVCVKANALADGKFTICDMDNDNAAKAGETRTAKWALQANGKTAVFVVNISYVEQPKVEAEIVKTIDVDVEYKAGDNYDQSIATATFDVAEVTAALGIENIADAKQYILNVTTGEYVENTTDGWRDANGDAAGWGTENGVCVKIQDPASGTIDYIGCLPGNTWTADNSYTAKWAFVYDGKAVVINVNIDFVTTVGINGIQADGKNVVIYDLQGRKLQKAVKGIVIVNGKKIMVK